MKTLLIIAAAVGLVSGSALAATPSGWSIGLAKDAAGAPGWLLLAGDKNHLHADGPPGRNFDGENGRPGYGHGDKNHFEPDTGEHDGPPGLDLEGEDERPGYGGNPADFEPD
jgi:hypothetical protein